MCLSQVWMLPKVQNLCSLLLDVGTSLPDNHNGINSKTAKLNKWTGDRVLHPHMLKESLVE